MGKFLRRSMPNEPVMVPGLEEGVDWSVGGKEALVVPSLGPPTGQTG